MKKLALKALATAAMSVAMFTSMGQSAHAMKLGGWNYALDSFQDGATKVGNKTVTGSKSPFEFYGIAYQETKTSINFAINANLLQSGFLNQRALNGRVSYGDLFLRFGNGTKNSSLLAVRFDGLNDSRKIMQSQTVTQRVWNARAKRWETKTTIRNQLVNATGVYSNVVGADLTKQNAAPKAAPGKQNPVRLTNIVRGKRVGRVSSLTPKQLAKLGLNFGRFGAKGRTTFGFSIDKALLPKGQFLASLFAENGADGMTLKGRVGPAPAPKPKPPVPANPSTGSTVTPIPTKPIGLPPKPPTVVVTAPNGVQPVPEPSTMAGTAVLGTFLGRRFMRRNNQQKPTQMTPS
ncbi:XDD3 family exosortase-dependent surface protein [Leptolyngbya sp. AN02str]|uniref:XDD3 family exosortase-dependent surface protein n=1 Tax=Leptolyngbya sp. AN02str TaxID=3423363 RepID=UPI003D30F333